VAAARAAATMPADKALALIDAGMRRWYESCRLGDTYPEMKAQLDAERAAVNTGPVDPGIREIADAASAPAAAPTT
jgi:hypothetical protein